MKKTLRIFATSLSLALFVLALAACTPPTPTPTPTPLATPTFTPTRVPISYDGQWDAGTLPDGLIQGELIFRIEKNFVTLMRLSYTMRFNGCTLMSSFSGTADESHINGDEFSATMYGDDGTVLSIAGTFTSAKEANGTLKLKGTHKDCGAFERNVKWNGENGPIPASPTATRPAPTATARPTTPVFNLPPVTAIIPTRTPTVTVRPELQAVINAIAKTKAAKIFQVTEELSGSSTLFNLPADPKIAEPILVYRQGQVNGAELAYTLSGALATLFGSDAVKGFEFRRIAGKGYVRGPATMLNVPDDRWYTVEPSRMGLFNFAPLGLIESIANQNAIVARLEKSLTGIVVDNLRCEVYAGGKDAAGDVFKAFMNNPPAWGVDQGKVEIQVCSDGYVHAINAKWEGHGSSANTLFAATLKYTLSDFDASMNLQAPQDPIASVTRTPTLIPR